MQDNTSVTLPVTTPSDGTQSVLPNASGAYCVSPGLALCVAGLKLVGRDGTIEQIEAAAYQQIHRGTYPFAWIRLGGGRRNIVVPVSAIAEAISAAADAQSPTKESRNSRSEESAVRGRSRGRPRKITRGDSGSVATQ